MWRGGYGELSDLPRLRPYDDLLTTPIKLLRRKISQCRSCVTRMLHSTSPLLDGVFLLSSAAAAEGYLFHLTQISITITFSSKGRRRRRRKMGQKERGASSSPSLDVTIGCDSPQEREWTDGCVCLLVCVCWCVSSATPRLRHPPSWLTDNDGSSLLIGRVPHT